jgi:crossover junction endodeoxyribonuclease RuvC
MIILGIDPGVRKCGYALVNFWWISNSPQAQIIDCGILFDDSTIVNRLDWFKKMNNIYEYFKTLIIDQKVQKVVIEKLYFTSRNQSNAEFVYGIRGALIIFCIANNITFQEIDPVQVKKYITWNGKAEKKLVQKKIMQLYNLDELPQYNDSADALGMAWIGQF